MAGQPTIDEVRADTDAMMQRVADEVPGGVPEVLPSNSPYLECAENSFYYSTRWTVAPEEGFDGSAFIEALPDRLGDGFREIEAVKVSVPAIALQHSSGMLLDVQVIDMDCRTVGVARVRVATPSPVGYQPKAGEDSEQVLVNREIPPQPPAR
ncbi:hypothetical protein ACU6RU_14230 [Microbacterium sp. F1-18]